MMDLTFFTISRPFAGEWKLIQSNAIRSWKRLGPDKIILFRQSGADKGVGEAAKEFGCVHRKVQLHKEFGVPIIQNAFDIAQTEAISKLMCFIHCEMILMDDFKAAIELVADRFDNFLMIGRRWGWRIDEPLDFSTSWQGQLREQAKTAKLYGRAGLSVFVFNRWLYKQGQATRALIGRYGDDIWLSSHITKRKTVPVIDATKAVMLIHQSHAVGVKRKRAEIEYNDRLVGDVSKGHAGYATWELTEEMKLIKRKKLPSPKWYPRKNGKFWKRRL